MLLLCLATSALPSLGKTYIRYFQHALLLCLLCKHRRCGRCRNSKAAREDLSVLFSYFHSAREKWVRLKCIRRAKCQRSTILRGACRVSAIVTRQEEGERKLVSGTNIELSPSPPSLSFSQPLALKWQRRMRELVVAILCSYCLHQSIKIQVLFTI